MKAAYGFKDSKGEFFIVVDIDQCDGCGACAEACPARVLEIAASDCDHLSDDETARVREEQLARLRSACAGCKRGGSKKLPCTSACPRGAMSHTW